MLRSLPVDGFRLAYERRGSGEAVILLHGWSGDHADWREVVGLLGDGADVVAPDLRYSVPGGFAPLEAPERFAGADVGLRRG